MQISESEEELLFAESALLPAAQKYWKSVREKCDDFPSHVEEELENELQFFVGYDVSIFIFSIPTGGGERCNL